MYAWVNAEERYSDRPRDSVTRVNGPANQIGFRPSAVDPNIFLFEFN